jgi:hypothetical protein
MQVFEVFGAAGDGVRALEADVIGACTEKQ